MDLVWKGAVGAVIVVLIQLLARSRNYYIAGLVPLFPTFALISHLMVGRERTLSELRETILFGMLSLIPYLVYLVALYLLVGRFRLELALLASIALWAATAAGLILLWGRL
jgi:membrane protein GlpM